MAWQLYQVDAFSSRLFSGNPAAVCPLPEWPADELLLAIAAENNLSETAYFVARDGGYELRWFTPVTEVDLCGHATLATAHVLFTELNYSQSDITFFTRSGELTVTQNGDSLTMNFPALHCESCDPPEALLRGLGHTPQSVLRGDIYLAVFASEQEVRSIRPDFTVLRQLDARSVGVTAAGTDVDFVSRYFAPKCGIDEDPVTGSFHCLLTPYWARRLQKTVFRARQISPRGGELECELVDERVLISGQCVTYMKAQLYL